MATFPSVVFVSYLLVFAIYIPSTFSYNNPCIHGHDNVPQNCERRIVPCGTIPVDGGVKALISATAGTWCVNNRIYIPEIYIVQFLDANNTCWEIRVQVGECWTLNPFNGGVYGCMGKCGGGCGGINCGAWARDCLRHDICSWFHSSEDGASDPNCGDEFVMAEDDFIMNRLCTGSDCKDLSVCS